MKIAVSACLLGAKVRFDAGHKHDHFITCLNSFMTLSAMLPNIFVLKK
jgi:uncharacterized protein YbbK (DUF523 family)